MGRVSQADESFPKVRVGIAVALAALLVLGVIAVSVLFSPGSTELAAPSSSRAAPVTGPVALVPVEAPAAGSAECDTLLTALPDTFVSGSSTLRRLALAKPAPPGAAAWAGPHGEPLVLRCGLPRPAELTPTARLREISGVKWLPVPGEGATTWYVVDRAVYVALTVPDGTGTGPLQDTSTTVGKKLPAKRVRPR